MAKQWRIAIAGAGVAGLAAATLLARDGHAVTVFEQTPALGPVGAGILLQPSGQRALAAMGLLTQTIEKAEPIHRLHAVTHRGHTLIDIAYGALAPGLLAYGLHRGDLFTVLHNAAREAGASFVLNTKATRYQHTMTEARLFDEAGTQLGAFDFVIAADGSRSTLRANSAIRHRAFTYPHGAVWATGTCDTVANKLFQLTQGTKLLCGLLPLGQKRASLFWSLRTAERDAFYARGFAAWREEMLALCPQAAPMFETLVSFEQTRFTNYAHVTMPRWFDERCLFIGDAAHAMSPHLGQGVNLALVDALCFARALRAREYFLPACEAYEQMRRRHLRFYSFVTRAMSPFFQSGGFIKGWGRDACLPLMPKLPWLRRQMVQTMSGIRAGFLGGEMMLPV